MPTRNIVPRGDGEGSVGTSAKKWDALWANKINNTNTADIIANTQDNYRQPDTTYTLGTIKYHHSLPTDYYLECTTQGTTSSGDLSISSTTIGDTVTDGTVTWTICKEIGTGNVPLVAGYNGKQTFTSSGSFTPTVTGIYKITLQGAGGGGGGAWTHANHNGGGGGGGRGAHGTFYESLTAGQSYSFTIGAGGTGGTGGNGNNSTGGPGGTGGNSSIIIGTNTYTANGGTGGGGHSATGGAGFGGKFEKNGDLISGYDAIDGTAGGIGSGYINGGCGGAGVSFDYTTGNLAVAGGGGYGGVVRPSPTVFTNGGAGGDGYITFEWQTGSLA